MWDIALFSMPIVTLIESFLHPEGWVIGRLFLLLPYIFLSSLVLDQTTRQALGVSGNRTQCITDIFIANENPKEMKKHILQPHFADSLEIYRIKSLPKYIGFCTSDEFGFNWHIYLFPHPESSRKSVLLIVGYTLTPFEILADNLTRNRLTGREAHVRWLLNDYVQLTGPESLESFENKYPTFSAMANIGLKIALKHTEIPLASVTRISAASKTLILAICIPILAITALYLGGYISPENLVVTLLPTFVLIALELFIALFRRKE